MNSKRPSISVDDLAKRLHADSEFAARWRKERDEERRKRTAEHRAAEAPVVQALRDAGVPVSSIWTDLVNSPGPYPSAIPVLLEHLQKSYPSRVLGGIARALAVPDARFAWPILAAEYRKTPEEQDGLGAKDGLAVALSATVTNDTIDELIALSKDPSHGSSRVLLLRGIRRSRTPQAKQAIAELASDPQLAREIASWRKR